MKSIKLLVVLMVLALSTAALTTAFANETDSGVIGKVSRKDGSAISGVKVEVSGTNLSGTKTTLTSVNGTYRLLLPTGSYKVVYTLEGFQTVTKTGINMVSGVMYKLNVIMKP